jgi:hypothetical protein
MLQRRTAPFGVIFAILAFAGCGGPRLATVKGTVTFNGKPVPNGTITFIHEGGSTATGEIQPDGSYVLGTNRRGDGAQPGNYKVVIVAMEEMSNRLPEDRNPLPPPIVPDKYTSAATTDLIAEVRPGDNMIDFPLTGEKKKR